MAVGILRLRLLLQNNAYTIRQLLHRTRATPELEDYALPLHTRHQNLYDRLKKELPPTTATWRIPLVDHLPGLLNIPRQQHLPARTLLGMRGYSATQLNHTRAQIASIMDSTHALTETVIQTLDQLLPHDDATPHLVTVHPAPPARPTTTPSSLLAYGASQHHPRRRPRLFLAATLLNYACSA